MTHNLELADLDNEILAERILELEAGYRVFAVASATVYDTLADLWDGEAVAPSEVQRSCWLACALQFLAASVLGRTESAEEAVTRLAGLTGQDRERIRRTLATRYEEMLDSARRQMAAG